MKMKGLLSIAAGAMLAAMAVGTVGAQDSASLVLWHAKQDAEGDALLALIDFCADNYGVTVEQVFNPSNTYQDSVRSAISTGEGPDMLIWANDWAGELADAGSIAPVTSLITDELHANASDTAWGLFTYKDDVWGIPYSAK
ncbi:MAG: extracellular solute-binding protein, partial [Chloroflexi bacterium OLB15]